MIFYFIVSSHSYFMNYVCVLLDKKFNILFSSFWLRVLFNYKMLLFGKSHESMLLSCFFFEDFFRLLLLLVATLQLMISGFFLFYPIILHFSHECWIFDGYHGFEFYVKSLSRADFFVAINRFCSGCKISYK